MRQKIITCMKHHPKGIACLLRIYNATLGGTRIRIPAKNRMRTGAVLMKKTKITVNGIHNTIIMKDFTSLDHCRIDIKGNNNHVIIRERVSLNQAELHIEDDNNEIIIGEHTSIHGATQLAAIEGTTIKIGRDCMLANDIQFRTGDSHSIIDLSGKRLNTSESISIGNHVWIGTKVICLKGVHIANNCIVGAGSLLTKRFDEDNAIIAGNPARIVKSEIDWLRERI